MATMDPSMNPGPAAAGVGTSAQVDDETLQGNLADAQAHADVTVADLDNYVSPTGGAGGSHIGAIDDRSGDTNSTTSI